MQVRFRKQEVLLWSFCTCHSCNLHDGIRCSSSRTYTYTHSPPPTHFCARSGACTNTHIHTHAHTWLPVPPPTVLNHTASPLYSPHRRPHMHHHTQTRTHVQKHGHPPGCLPPPPASPGRASPLHSPHRRPRWTAAGVAKCCGTCHRDQAQVHPGGPDGCHACVCSFVCVCVHVACCMHVCVFFTFMCVFMRVCVHACMCVCHFVCVVQVRSDGTVRLGRYGPSFLKNRRISLFC